MRIGAHRHKILALLAAALAAFAAAPATAQEPASAPRVAGIWQGTLTAPTASLRLVVKLREEAGGLTGTLDSIDQGARDLPLDTVRYESGRLTFELRAVGGRYEGELAASGGEIAETWTQGGNLPLTFKRDANVPVVKRPQEPALPLPYREEEVAYDSVPGVRPSATLTLPAGDGPFPAVLLITGSGPQDRDESLAGHRPFYVLADALTRRGIAVLRADIRRDAIGLVGHSEGGLVAPLAAVREAPEARELKFLVLLAGPGVPLGDILVEQNRLILAARGVPAPFIDADSAMLRRLVEIAKTDHDVERAAATMRTELAA